MIKASIDRPKLEKSLKRFAKEFGDTSAQALVRWAVQSCRELAFETQAWGSKGAKKTQEGAILKDAYNVLLVVDELKKTSKGFRATNQGKSYSVKAGCMSPDEVNEWIEIHRTRRRGRTAVIPITERKAVDRKVFKKAMATRFKKSGIAKGGWIGAGQQIAKAQTGIEKVNIGKNFLSYAQKHGHFGSATRPKSGWSPFVGISNRSSHSSDKNVLTGSAPKRAFDFSLKKTVKWYEKALKAQDSKQKI